MNPKDAVASILKGVAGETEAKAERHLKAAFIFLTEGFQPGDIAELRDAYNNIREDLMEQD